MTKNAKAIEMNNVRHEIKDNKLIITVDLAQAQRLDLPLTSKGRSYQLATSNGFRVLEGVKGFENVAFAVNAIVDKKAYEAYVTAQSKPAAPAKGTATPSSEVEALRAVVAAQQAQMAQLMESMQKLLAVK